MPQILYSPLHWLAYWDDHNSVNFLLSTVSGRDSKKVQRLFRPNSDDLTPLDIAGVNNAHETLLHIINYFQDNFHILEQVFEVEKLKSNKSNNNNNNKVDQVKSEAVEEKKEHSFPWVINFVKTSDMSDYQSYYARIFFWSAFLGKKMLCQRILSRIGISPFVKLLWNQNVVNACINGCQYNLLKLLVENSKQGAHINFEGEKKYIIKNPSDEEYFLKSRANKSKSGNNSCHLAFEIVEKKMRYKILRLLIDEHIGDLYKPNKLGYLAHHIEHSQPLDSLPEDVLPFFPTVLQEI